MQLSFDEIIKEKRHFVTDRFKQLTQDADPELIKKFWEYNSRNPGLYSLFKKYTLEAYHANRARFSIWMIANRARWYSAIETSGKDFKISNDYLALYARLLVSDCEFLEGFFKFKQMKKRRSEARE